MNRINSFSDNENDNSLFKTIFDNNKHRHLISVSSKNINDLRLLFDTGSDMTLISRSTLKDITGLSEEELSNKLSVSREQVITTATGEKIETLVYPCCILNATIGSLVLPKLFFTTLSIDSNSLLGSDFIDFCDITKTKLGVYQITDFDYINYEREFVSKFSYKVNSYLDSCDINYFGGD